MIIYGGYIANAPCRIDFFEFKFKEVPEKFMPKDHDENRDLILPVSWDESDWSYNETTHEGLFRLKGVDINEIYANGHLDMFKDADIDYIQVYGPEDAGFVLEGLEFYDGDRSFSYPKNKLAPRELYYEED